MPATVTMPYTELKDLERNIETMTEQIQKLTQDVVDARMTDPAGTIRQLAMTFRDSLKIITFAVANLSPEIIKRWPYVALINIADALSRLPDRTSADDDLATELRKFAAECANWEAKRKAEPERYVPPPIPNQREIESIVKKAQDVPILNNENDA